MLANLAEPVARLQWRFREIPVSSSSTAIVEVELSTDGTKALVVFADGTPRVLDLTERITQISVGDVSASQHRSPHQLFPYAAAEKVCLLDDMGQSGERPCMEAAAASVHGDGRVLYAFKDGRLAVVSPQSGIREELPYRLPLGANFQLLAGHQGDLRDFLVLVTEPGTDQNGATPVSVATIPVTSIPLTKIIDPRQPAVSLGQFTNPTVAALRAQLEFTGAGAVSAKLEARRTEQVSESTLETLAAHLAAHLAKHPNDQTRSDKVTWSFYRVTAIHGTLCARPRIRRQ